MGLSAYSGVSSVYGSNSADGVASSAGVPCDLDSSAAVGTIALVDSSKRVVFDGGSQFLVDDSSSTASAVAVRPHACVAAQAFLTACEEHSKMEEAAIAAACAGRISPRSSREDGYVVIPKPGDVHRDWPAMILIWLPRLRFPTKIFASSRNGRIIKALCYGSRLFSVPR